MADGHALRPPGRARGVDDVAQVVERRAGVDDGEALAFFRGDHGRLVHVHDLRASLGHEPGEPRVRQHRPDAGVGDDVGDPIRREPWVHRHVDGVHLEHREHADVAVHRIVEQQADPVAGLDAKPADQEPRDPVGRRVELVVGRPAGPSTARSPPRPARRSASQWSSNRSSRRSPCRQRKALSPADVRIFPSSPVSSTMGSRSLPRVAAPQRNESVSIRARAPFGLSGCGIALG